jgi:hypothetical protein
MFEVAHLVSADVFSDLQLPWPSGKKTERRDGQEHQSVRDKANWAAVRAAREAASGPSPPVEGSALSHLFLQNLEGGIREAYNAIEVLVDDPSLIWVTVRMGMVGCCGGSSCMLWQQV